MHVDFSSSEGLLARFLARACAENPRIEEVFLDRNVFDVTAVSGPVLRVTVERIR